MDALLLKTIDILLDLSPLHYVRAVEVYRKLSDLPLSSLRKARLACSLAATDALGVLTLCVTGISGDVEADDFVDTTYAQLEEAIDNYGKQKPVAPPTG